MRHQVLMVTPVQAGGRLSHASVTRRERGLGNEGLRPGPFVEERVMRTEPALRAGEAQGTGSVAPSVAAARSRSRIARAALP